MDNTNITIDLIPISKKNSQQIIRVKGRPCIIPSKQYKAYEKEAVKLIRQQYESDPIGEAVNVAMVFYMPTRRRVDLVNLQEAALDVMVKAGVLKDDNSSIVATMDRSAVRYDKEHPRTEIRITDAAGYWIEKTDFGESTYKISSSRFYCSDCGAWNTYGPTEFCPHCGAPKRGGEHADTDDDL